jgi:hypothetical protein
MRASTILKDLRKFLLLTSVLYANILCFALAENVTVYDYSEGKYKQYDVEQHGNNLDVYDYETGHYKYFDMDSQGNLYDWQEHRFYDIKMDSSGKQRHSI